MKEAKKEGKLMVPYSMRPETVVNDPFDCLSDGSSNFTIFK